MVQLRPGASPRSRLGSERHFPRVVESRLVVTSRSVDSRWLEFRSGAEPVGGVWRRFMLLSKRAPRWTGWEQPRITRIAE